MKRSLSLPLFLLGLLLLCACGQSAPARSVEGAPSEAAVSEEYPLSPFSLEESRRMACFLSANRALVEDGFLYCYDFDENWSPVLARYSLRSGTPRRFTVLARDCVPEYLCAQGDSLFYIDRRSGDLERLPKAGGQREILRKGPCDFLSLRDGTLYFCDGEGCFCSLDPALGEETVILDGPCAYPYPLENAILYQALDDGRLHLYCPEDQTDRLLSPEEGRAPLIVADRLWYSGQDGLHSVGLSGEDPILYPLPSTMYPAELLPGEDGLLVRCLWEANGPRQEVGPPEGPFSGLGRGYRLCDWLGGGWQVDTVYEPDGRIRCFLLRDEKGRETSFIAGRA